MEKAALLILRLGRWPTWTPYVIASMQTNVLVRFYFASNRPPTGISACKNCMWLPTNANDLRLRIAKYLNLTNVGSFTKNRLCDMKPMWLLLFSRELHGHSWIGYVDLDVIWGNIDEHVARLTERDDMLVPSERFPYPITNGNFMLVKHSDKMLQAFRRDVNWRRVFFSKRYLGFDEWGRGDLNTMAVVYENMYLSSQLRIAVIDRPLVQDMIVVLGQSFPSIEKNATVSLRWLNGRLGIHRIGPCWCPCDHIPQYGITGCSMCLRRKNQCKRFQKIITSRHTQIFGFHFQQWKKYAQFTTLPIGKTFVLNHSGFFSSE